MGLFIYLFIYVTMYVCIYLFIMHKTAKNNIQLIQQNNGKKYIESNMTKKG